MFEAILITGCGGDIAISLARTIREEKLAQRIIGVDIHERFPTSEFYDEFYLVPKADNLLYLQKLEEIVNKAKPSIVIPQSDAELRLLHTKKFTTLNGVPLVMANQKVLEICLDKLATANFLEKEGFLFPWTFPVSQPPKELPCIVKHPRSQGSKTVFVVQPGDEIYFARKFPDAIWQELLIPDNEEYTCGLYRSNEGEIRSIIIHRTLAGGLTNYGEIVKNSQITQLLEDIATKLELRGSINVQLRMTKRGPVIFEINPRFSSTVRFRHLLNFTDLVWALQEAKGEKISSYDVKTAKNKFFRGSQEYLW